MYTKIFFVCSHSRSLRYTYFAGDVACVNRRKQPNNASPDCDLAIYIYLGLHTFVNTVICPKGEHRGHAFVNQPPAKRYAFEMQMCPFSIINLFENRNTKRSHECDSQRYINLLYLYICPCAIVQSRLRCPIRLNRTDLKIKMKKTV